MATGTMSKERLLLELVMDAQQYKEEMDKVARKTDTWHGKMAKGFEKQAGPLLAMGKSMKLLGGLAAAAAGAAGFGKLLGMTGQMGEFAKTLEMTSERMGVTTQWFQEMSFVAGQTNIDIRALEMGLQRMTRRSGEAAQGFGEALPAFKKLGIELTDDDNRMRKTADIFEDIMGSLGGMNSEAQQLAVGFRFFDSEGVAMVAMAQRMDALKDKFHELNLLIGQEQVDALAKAGEATKIWSALWIKMKADALDTLGPISKAVAELAAKTYAAATVSGDTDSVLDLIMRGPTDNMSLTSRLRDINQIQGLTSSPAGVQRIAAEFAVKARRGRANREGGSIYQDYYEDLQVDDILMQFLKARLAELKASVPSTPGDKVGGVADPLQTALKKIRDSQYSDVQSTMKRLGKVGEPPFAKFAKDVSVFAANAVGPAETAHLQDVLLPKLNEMWKEHEVALTKMRLEREEAEKSSWDRVGESMLSSGLDAFEGLLAGGEQTWAELLQSFRSIFANVARNELEKLLSGDTSSIAMVANFLGGAFGVLSKGVGVVGDWITNDGATVTPPPRPHRPGDNTTSNAAWDPTIIISNYSSGVDATANPGAGVDGRAIEVVIEDIAAASMYSGKVNRAWQDVSHQENKGVSGGVLA